MWRTSEAMLELAQQVAEETAKTIVWTLGEEVEVEEDRRHQWITRRWQFDPKSRLAVTVPRNSSHPPIVELEEGGWIASKVTKLNTEPVVVV